MWQLKEVFECVALVGFVFFIIGFASLLIELPFFNKVKTELNPMPSIELTGSKIGIFALLLCLILVPGVFFSALMDGSGDARRPDVRRMRVRCHGTDRLYLWSCQKGQSQADLCRKHLRDGRRRGACSHYALQDVWTGKFWNALGVNSIVYWTIACAAISLLAMSVVYLVGNADKDVTFKHYGVTFHPVKILLSILIAVITYAVAYGVLFLVDLTFKADFRIWTFAFKTFDLNIFPTIFRYFPTFLAYYVVSTAAITINTNTGKMQGFKGYLLAIALNAGGGFLWLVHQYGMLFTTGVAAHPGSALSGIVLGA